MAKLTTAEFIEAIKELSVLELNDLVKACEEEFGVSAAAAPLRTWTSAMCRRRPSCTASTSMAAPARRSPLSAPPVRAAPGSSSTWVTSAFS